VQGAQQILLGESRVVLAGGTESMSPGAPCRAGLRWGVKLGQSPQLEDLLWQGLTDAYCGCPMGITAENLAVKYGIPRARRGRVRPAKPARRQGRLGCRLVLPMSSARFR
jgi:acetyl-CoA acetyltransferase